MNSPMDELPNLDATALERLRQLGGDDFVSKMIGLFLQYVSGKVAEARSAFDANDLEGVRQAVHPVKSSAGNVGAARVHAWAVRLEILAKQSDPISVAAGLNQLERAFAEVRPQLEEEKRRAEQLDTARKSPPV